MTIGQKPTAARMGSRLDESKPHDRKGPKASEDDRNGVLEMRGDEGGKQGYRVAAGGAPVALDDDTVWPVEPDGAALIKAITPENTVEMALGIRAICKNWEYIVLPARIIQIR